MIPALYYQLAKIYLTNKMSLFKPYLVTTEGYQGITSLSEILFPEIDIKLKEYKPSLKLLSPSGFVSGIVFCLRVALANGHEAERIKLSYGPKYTNYQYCKNIRIPRRSVFLNRLPDHRAQTIA